MKPSDLIREAVTTMDSLSRRRYVPDIYEWHTPHRHRPDLLKRCHVCLAGTLLTKKLKPKEMHYFSNTSTADRAKLIFLDAISRNALYSGLRELGISDKRAANIEDKVDKRLRKGLPFQSWKEWDTEKKRLISLADAIDAAEEKLNG